jgi:hypothetical protein
MTTQEKEFNNGTYRGDLTKDGKREGRGVLRFKNGDRYEGIAVEWFMSREVKDKK